MPYDEPDCSDPNELVGVVLPAEAEAVRDMAYVFAEEFARMGMGADAVMALFRAPFYGGAHQAWRALGEGAVRAIVDECVGVWGRAAGPIREAPPPGGERLPWPVFPGRTPLGD